MQNFAHLVASNDTYELIRLAKKSITAGNYRVFRHLLNNACPFREEYYDLAVAENKLKIFKILYNRGYIVTDNVCKLIATLGLQQFIEFLKYRGYSFGYDLIDCAILHNHSILAIYMLENNISFVSSNTVEHAVRSGNVYVMHVIGMRYSIVLNNKLLQIAIQQNNIYMVTWLLDNGCPYDESTLELAKNTNEKIFKTFKIDPMEL